MLGYIPGMQQISYKGMIYGVNKKKRYTDLTYKDMPTFDFKNNLSKITIWIGIVSTSANQDR